MPIAPPATRSPGKVCVDYLGLGSFKHRASLRLVSGSFPVDEAAAMALAVTMVTSMQPCFNEESFTVLGWALLNQENVQVAGGPFAVDYIGTNGVTVAGAHYPSSSFSLIGRGHPPNLTTVAGQTRLTLFTGSTWAIPAAVHHVTSTAYPEIDNLIDLLNSLDPLGADVYGQAAEWRHVICPQYNAGIQRKHGA